MSHIGRFVNSSGDRETHRHIGSLPLKSGGLEYMFPRRAPPTMYEDPSVYLELHQLHVVFNIYEIHHKLSVSIKYER